MPVIKNIANFLVNKNIKQPKQYAHLCEELHFDKVTCVLIQNQQLKLHSLFTATIRDTAIVKLQNGLLEAIREQGFRETKETSSPEKQHSLTEPVHQTPLLCLLGKSIMQCP